MDCKGVGKGVGGEGEGREEGRGEMGGGGEKGVEQDHFCCHFFNDLRNAKLFYLHGRRLLYAFNVSWTASSVKRLH